jgi:pyridoxal phosphate-dependent aminotransferase EpsN
VNPRLYLSPPHIGETEAAYVREAFASNWIAPIGPHVDAFEAEFAARVGAPHAAALSSGTAGLHLSLDLLGVSRDDLVLCSTLTFIASANPIVYLGGHPVFIDSERASWNMDPDLLARELDAASRRGQPVKAVVVTHLYGQCADLDRIVAACERHSVPLIEDAAEALGASHGGASAGVRGRTGVFSFNGNKIITTSGGGMLVSSDESLVRRARFLASQAREAEAHYEHRTIGYNYRLSNVLAGIGRGQLAVLDDRVSRRRANFDFYHKALAGEPGIAFMPEAPWGRSSRWLTVIQIDHRAFGATREEVRLRLEAANIESRPVWKPLHLQPVFKDCRVAGGEVAEELFANGLCLPSGSQMTGSDLNRVVECLLSTPRGGRS